MAYWAKMGWLDKKTAYFQNVRIGPAKRAVGWLFAKIIGLAAVKMQPASRAEGSE